MSSQDQPPPSQPPPSAPSEPSTTTTTSNTSPFALRNSTKLLLGGSLFLLLSTLITRRSLRRRSLASMPAYYTSAPHHQPNVNGPMEALEALNIASINVASFAMLGVGAGMHFFEINTLEDLRRKVRGGLGVDGSGRSERQVEEELEEWVVSVLHRKEDKEKKGEPAGGDDKKWVNSRGKER